MSKENPTPQTPLDHTERSGGGDGSDGSGGDGRRLVATEGRNRAWRRRMARVAGRFQVCEAAAAKVAAAVETTAVVEWRWSGGGEEIVAMAGRLANRGHRDKKVSKK